jgi:hypothetical protein
MQDFEFVQGGQSLHDLYENVPDLFLFELAPFFLVLEDLLQQIAAICVLHDDAFLVELYHRDLVDES